MTPEQKQRLSAQIELLQQQIDDLGFELQLREDTLELVQAEELLVERNRNNGCD